MPVAVGLLTAATAIPLEPWLLLLLPFFLLLWLGSVASLLVYLHAGHGCSLCRPRRSGKPPSRAVMVFGRYGWAGWPLVAAALYAGVRYAPHTPGGVLLRAGVAAAVLTVTGLYFSAKRFIVIFGWAGTTVLISRFHQNYQPWCPYCHGGRGGTDDVQVAPDPAPSHGQPMPVG